MAITIFYQPLENSEIHVNVNQKTLTRFSGFKRSKERRLSYLLNSICLQIFYRFNDILICKTLKKWVSL